MVPSIYYLPLLLCTLLLIAPYGAVRSPKGSHALLTASNKTASGRDARIFSIFSIVQFPNSGCTTTSGTYTGGTCFTSSECSSKGGAPSGSCAAGFGICCVFTVSASSSTITENCTYLINPDYPSSFVATTTPATLIYNVEKCQDDICRIRLDYETFILTQPSAAAILTEGQCITDRLEFTTTGQTQTPGDNLATNLGTNYGSYPYLCGTNSGLHSYLDLSLTATDTATLTFTIGDAVLNQYKIKVTQLSCYDNEVAQQQQCFQYFTGQTGTVSSYNYAGAQMLAYTQYTACIRQEEDNCCIQWSQLTATTFRGGESAIDAAGTGNACTSATIAQCSSVHGCTFDFVLIPNSGAELGLQTNLAANDRYCGPALSPRNAATPQPVISCTLPFTLGHQTGATAVASTTVLGGQNSQFQLTYSQIPGTC